MERQVTGRQTDRHRQTNKQAGGQTGRKKDSQADRQTERKVKRQTYKHKDKPTTRWVRDKKVTEAKEFYKNTIVLLKF